MPRAATTSDAFNAIAEPKRRRVLSALVSGERTVNALADTLQWSQPQVSKHLGVLRQVGLVNVRKRGRERHYSLRAERLKPVHDWVGTFSAFWDHQLAGIKLAAESRAKSSSDTSRTP